MHPILLDLDTPYVEAQTLLALLRDYREPRSCIEHMVKKGDLIRLKNGFYLLGRTRQIPYESIANLLYGPSYVSLEWALSFYGLIPERVMVVTSISTGRNKTFHTPIGAFIYRHAPLDRYCIGIDRKETKLGGFLMATPEKALIDAIHFSCQGLNQTELFQELIESKRIEVEELKNLDKALVFMIAKNYHSSVVKEFAEIIGKL
ncbi:MAG TPA: hypothetical protein VLE89_03030 [Chlamydiales bacterium]|nr:hypothetical protein [Chlamydiales bacterium]